MQIKVKVVPGSKEDRVIESKEGITVKVKAQARKGQANLAAILLLSKHFGKQVILVKGHRSKTKIFEV